MLCILAGLTVAEHFRDAEGQDVLLFIDNIFRFTQVGSDFCFAAKNVTLSRLLSVKHCCAALQDQKFYYCLHFPQCLLLACT